MRLLFHCFCVTLMSFLLIQSTFAGIHAPSILRTVYDPRVLLNALVPTIVQDTLAALTTTQYNPDGLLKMTDDLVTAAVKKLPAWQEAALAEIELAIARRYPSSSEQKLIGDKLISEYFIARLHKVLLKLKGKPDPKKDKLRKEREEEEHKILFREIHVKVEESSKTYKAEKMQTGFVEKNWTEAQIEKIKGEIGAIPNSLSIVVDNYIRDYFGRMKNISRL